MGSPLAEITLFVAAYLVGGIPFGWLFARLLEGVDLREVGSGNIGATNCSRLWSGATSIGVFALIFLLDFGKGLFVALFSLEAAEVVGLWLDAQSGAWALQVICGLGAILGHSFTPYLGLRGGKGVATTFGVVTALAPLSSLFGLGAWGMLVALTRYMSLGSLAAMAAIPVSYLIEYGEETFRSRLVVFAFLLAIAVLVIWRHRGNIVRIWQGRERKVGAANQL